jgi:hypothetical protein
MPKMAALYRRRAARAARHRCDGVVCRRPAEFLVIGSADRAQRAAALLADRLDVSLLLPRAGGTLGARPDDAGATPASRRGSPAGSARSR